MPNVSIEEAVLGTGLDSPSGDSMADALAAPADDVHMLSDAPPSNPAPSELTATEIQKSRNQRRKDQKKAARKTAAPAGASHPGAARQRFAKPTKPLRSAIEVAGEYAAARLVAEQVAAHHAAALAMPPLLPQEYAVPRMHLIMLPAVGGLPLGDELLTLLADSDVLPTAQGLERRWELTCPVANTLTPIATITLSVQVTAGTSSAAVARIRQLLAGGPW